MVIVRLLDTDILVDILRGHRGADGWFRSLSEMPAVSGLAVMEAIQGCRNAAEVQAVNRLVSPMEVVWPREPDCRRALTEFNAWFLSHNLGLLDALIGASAAGIGATLCTFNVRHYQLIPDLVTEQPYAR